MKERKLKKITSEAPASQVAAPAAPDPAPQHENDAAPAAGLTIVGCLTAQQLGALFALPEKLHASDAADEWRAKNVVQQFEGIDVLRPGAKEKLKEWYRIHAWPYFQNKLAAKHTAARAKAARARAERKKDQHASQADRSDRVLH